MLATWGTSTGFNPASLFAGGVQGAWYDPSDNTTMFQDSAGTTPVTAVEQAVGLILDKSKGLVLGGSLISGGAIGVSGVATAATYNTGTGVGTATRVDVGNQSFVEWSGLTPAGSLYEVTIQNTGATFLVVRHGFAGAIQLTVSAGATVTARLLSSSLGTLTIAAANNGTSVAFTVQSFRALAGNHAFQSTSASRPTLRARYNLLTFSEQFDNAAWSKVAAGVAVAPVVTANAGTAPDGTTTADRIQFDCGNAGSSANRSYITPLAGNPITLGVSYIASVYVKAFDAGNVGRQIRFAIDSFTSGVFTLTADWQRITLTATAAATITSNFLIETRGTFTQQTADVLVWGAQFIQTAVFPSNTYQRIAAATDYDTGAAFPQYLAFDGTDDSLLTASVDFTGTDKMTVFSGLSKLSDAASAVLIELSSGTPNDRFAVRAPNSAAANYSFVSGGTAVSTASSSNTFAAPITNVLTGSGEIQTDICVLRVNAAQAATSATDQGTGNFGNYPLFIGRRNNATLPFNGRIYSLIVRGAASNTTQVAQTERYVASKTPLGVVP